MTSDDLSDMTDSLENIADPKTVQKARVALIEHHTSQMQQYKYYMLTLALGFLATLDLWSRAKDFYSPWPYVDVLTIVRVVFGLVIALIFYSFARFIWYGKILSSTFIAPLKMWRSEERQYTLTYHLHQCITEHARKEANRNRYPLRWLFHLGDKQLRLVITCAVLSLVAMCIQVGDWGAVLFLTWLILLVSTIFEVTT